MATTSNFESKIKFWLTSILKEDNLTNLSVNLHGTTEKGDGYLGDIVFVHATGTTEDASTKEYNLVLKCSKRSEVLREKMAVSDIFLNEIFFYEEMLPSFREFQKKKGVKKPFDSVPKCYGSFVRENMEIIALENLKKLDFDLWPKKQPLTRKHIDLVTKEYAKFHAISAAIKEDQPEQFQKVAERLENNTKRMWNPKQTEKLFGSCIDEVCEVLKNDLDEQILIKWRAFKEQIPFIYKGLQDHTGFKVVRHGDCWNNNFMYKYKNGDQKDPSEVRILDWQVTSYASPIYDLSYFLFTCISKEDIENLDDILKNYHKSFSDQLKELMVPNLDNIYPLNQFLDDWKNDCKYGVLMTSLILKICCTDKDEVVDIAENAERGKEFGETFANEIKDKDAFKNRMRHIVEYAAKRELI